MPTRYFEDFAVGDVFAAGGRSVERDEVIAFASRYDPQPFHLSDEGARGTFCGRVAASGWHTCAMTMALMIEAWGGANAASLGSPGVDELRWLKPVYPGDVLGVRMEIVAVKPSRSRPEMGAVSGVAETSNQDGAAVLRFRSVGLYRLRGTDAAGTALREGM